MKTRIAVAVLLVSALVAACGIEGPFINAVTRDQSTEVPKAADNVVRGRVLGAPAGAAIAVQAGSGTIVEGIKGSVAADGSFELRFPGNTDYASLRLDVRWSGGQFFGIVPSAPKQVSVLDPERVIDLESDVPALAPLSGATTAYTLVILGSALSQGRTLSSLPPDTIRTTAAALDGLAGSNNAAVTGFVSLVEGLLAKAGSAGHPFPATFSAAAGVRGLVDATFLSDAATGVTAEEFEQALLAAAAEIDVAVCYDPDTIRVVFLADMRGGSKDLNCETIDPFLWAKDEDGKGMYFTGGIHKTTPACGGDVVKPYCITQEEMDTSNGRMGNWVPNQIPMYDDGTNGDALANDRIFTLTLDLPYFDADLAPGGIGMRIGYKYTWGKPKQGWTGSEEWPGNQRILELVDVNGDGLIVRMDAFADQTTNKDKMNQLTPANGGCGVNFFEAEAKAKCSHDTREALVDSDGDCKLDGLPPAGPVSPLTVPCS